MTAKSIPPGHPWRVFVVEDHATVRRGFDLLLSLEPDMTVCGESEGAIDAFERMRTLPPDVAIIDLTLKDGSGLELIPRLRAEHPDLRILVVSMHDQIAWIEEALRVGADGYLTKDETTEQLIPAIRQILDGKRFLSDRVAARLSARGGRGRDPRA